ncbi:hypothetical protein [Burkholderia multivorans]|uniref:hypothetical protein n=1 Tax=Burkholderia multivorans TaxID=87883 RepID=UPI001C222C29|nr:hypothetical protein [Burkholderia multivorans]MBU9553877.1 hypothetical protein [Burkholderia multivorans]
MLPNFEQWKFEYCKSKPDTETWISGVKAVTFNVRNEVFYIWNVCKNEFKVYKKQEAISMLEEMLTHYEISNNHEECVLYIHDNYNKEK